MGRYYYPNENDALSAKIQFLREHHYKINHCFRNTWGTGFVLFDTKEDVNEWYKENTGHPFYTEVYEKGAKYTETDAINEIENRYGGGDRQCTFKARRFFTYIGNRFTFIIRFWE